MRKPIPIDAALHEKPYFLFPGVLKRWFFQKNCTGKWSFLYYQRRWYFFFPKIWPYLLDEKWKMIFLKKTRKYDMFFKLSEKMFFSKRVTLGHDRSCIIWKDGIFFPKTWHFFLGRKVRDDLSQEAHGNMIFSVYKCGCYNCGVVPLCQKNQRWSYPGKMHLKVIDFLDWYSRKNSSSSLYFHGDLYRHFLALQQEKLGNLIDRIEVWLLL